MNSIDRLLEEHKSKEHELINKVSLLEAQVRELTSLIQQALINLNKQNECIATLNTRLEACRLHIKHLDNKGI